MRHERAEPGPARYPSCSCGAQGILDARYDAYYCPVSGIWLETQCKTPNCRICSDRSEPGAPT